MLYFRNHNISASALVFIANTNADIIEALKSIAATEFVRNQINPVQIGGSAVVTKNQSCLLNKNCIFVTFNLYKLLVTLVSWKFERFWYRIFSTKCQ